ncbi:MAG: flagellar motor protein MotB, partial [Rhodanobacter sp.]
VAQLSPSADTVLQRLATILARFPNPLRVEGFTDNVPISTAQYPSNWELSAARAASVARLFAVNGVAPDRLGIIGWGEVRPLADNATAQGRNQNRRVLVVVMHASKAARRQPSDAAHLREIAGAHAPAPALDRAPTVATVQSAAEPSANRARRSAVASMMASESQDSGAARRGADASPRVVPRRTSANR